MLVSCNLPCNKYEEYTEMCGFTWHYNRANDDNNNWNPLSDNNIVFRDLSVPTCRVKKNFFLTKHMYFFI